MLATFALAIANYTVKLFQKVTKFHDIEMISPPQPTNKKEPA